MSTQLKEDNNCLDYDLEEINRQQFLALQYSIINSSQKIYSENYLAKTILEQKPKAPEKTNHFKKIEAILSKISFNDDDKYLFIPERKKIDSLPTFLRL